MNQLTQQKVGEIVSFLEQSGGEILDNTIEATMGIQRMQLIGENYPWYYFVDPLDGHAKVRHQSLGPPSGNASTLPSNESSSLSASLSYGPTNGSQDFGSGCGLSPCGAAPYSYSKGSTVMGMVANASQMGLSEATGEDSLYAEQFLMVHQVDEHAANTFRSCSADVQKIVINKGSMQGARDQTAVLTDRMRKASQAITTGNIDATTTPFAQPGVTAKPGDWVCPGCLDLQFARNAACRKCQTPNPKLQVIDPEVDSWLLANNIQDHAAMRFKGFSKEMQQMIVARGSLDGARDPTAVLMSRMRQAEQGSLDVRGSPEPQNGDWFCPGCNDLQFRRNTQCRKCGTPNPNPEGKGKKIGGNQFGGKGKPFGGNHFDGKQFGGNQYGTNKFDGNLFVGSQFVGNQFGGNQFSGNQVSGNQFGGNQVGGSQFEGNQFDVSQGPGSSMQNMMQQLNGMQEQVNPMPSVMQQFDSMQGQGNPMQDMMQQLAQMMKGNNNSMNQQLIQQLAHMTG